MKRLHNVLILNSAWVPTNIVSWEKAISLVYSEKARALDGDYIHYDLSDWLEFSKKPAGFTVLNSVNYKIALPEIAVLRTFNRLHISERGVSYSRQSVLERDGYKCIYCAGVFKIKDLTIEHIYPKHLGGKTNYLNCASCCLKCNNQKGGKTLEESGMKLQFQPSEPKWLGHKGRLPDIKSWSRYIQQVESKPDHNPSEEPQK